MTALLTAQKTAEFGVEPGWSVGLPFTIRWCEVDPFNHVNNGTYLVWCEETRHAYFETLSLEPIAADRPGPIIKELGFVFERPLVLGDSVLVTARFEWIRRTSFRMGYAVWSKGLIGRGHAICIWFNHLKGESVQIPVDLREKIMKLDAPEDLNGTNSLGKT